jgi:hypothetical protein
VVVLVVRHVQQMSTGVSGRIWSSSASSRVGQRALSVSVAVAYGGCHLFDLLVEGAAERLHAFE